MPPNPMERVMVAPEHKETVDPVEESLVKLANDTGNAVLVLNSGINSLCFRDVLTAFDNLSGHHDTLSLILNSGGGEIEYAFWIAKAIREQCNHLNVMVHDRAKSAATLIALAADRIYLGQFGELGPLDPQVRDPAGRSSLRSPLESVKGLEYLRRYYVETIDLLSYMLERSGMDMAHALEHATGAASPVAEALYRSVNYRELGEAVQRLTIGEEYAKETMRRWSPLDEDAYEHVVRQLVWDYPDHGHIIDVEEARRIGLTNVERLPDRLENLCWSVANRQEPLAMVALPDNRFREENGGVSDSSPEGEQTNECGTSCEQ